MKANMQSCVSGRSATLILSLAVAIGGALAAWRPWAKPAPSEARLRARLDQYVELRKASNWKSLYAMTDPLEQARVGIESFLTFYGKEMTRFHSLEVKEARMDAEHGRATIDVEVEHEMIPERLPPAFRRGLKVDDKSLLTQRSPTKLEWVWRDGEWYLGMDRVVLTGRDKEGRAAKPEKH